MAVHHTLSLGRHSSPEQALLTSLGLCVEHTALSCFSLNYNKISPKVWFHGHLCFHVFNHMFLIRPTQNIKQFNKKIKSDKRIFCFPGVPGGWHTSAIGLYIRLTQNTKYLDQRNSDSDLLLCWGPPCPHTLAA